MASVVAGPLEWRMSLAAARDQWLATRELANVHRRGRRRRARVVVAWLERFVEVGGAASRGSRREVRGNGTLARLPLVLVGDGHRLRNVEIGRLRADHGRGRRVAERGASVVAVKKRRRVGWRERHSRLPHPLPLPGSRWRWRRWVDDRRRPQDNGRTVLLRRP
jgi:hypothetical protein